MPFPRNLLTPASPRSINTPYAQRTAAFSPVSGARTSKSSKEAIMPNPVRAIPEGYHSITPALTCKRAAGAIDFYKSIFGATEIMRMPGPDGKVMHGEIRIGDSIIFVSDEFPGMSCAPTPGATNPVYIVLYTENVDATFNRAVAAGAKVDMPLADQFWGDRYGKSPTHSA